MKRLLLLLNFVSFATMVHSQDQVTTESLKAKNEIGISSSIGFCKLSRNQDHTEIVSAHGKTVVSYGLNYIRTISRKIKLETGVIYANYAIVNHVIFDGLDFNANENFKIISIPIIVRYYFPRDYYISGGTILDFGSSKGPYVITGFQNGFGLSIGVGKEIMIDRFSLSVATNFDMHSAIPFSGVSKQKFLVPGIKIGLNFKI